MLILRKSFNFTASTLHSLMIDKIYFVLNSLSFGITFSLGCCFLFLKIPDIQALRNYRKARIIMAVAYIIMAILYVLEVIFYPEKIDLKTNQFVNLTMGSFQAFLFTYMFISLINLHFVTIKKILLEMSAILFFSIMLFATLTWTSNQHYFDVVFYAFIVYYCFMLIRYIAVFLKEYHRYIFQVDNYYSEEKSVQFRWIYYSFFAALIIGTGALLLSFTVDVFHYVLFTVAFIAFYFYFGIRFIDYAILFQTAEPVLVADEETLDLNIFSDKSEQNLFEESISNWLRQEKYLNFGLTLEFVAKELNTNRTYLSNYINMTHKRTFREWINYLRIEKSKKILLSHPHIPLKEIATLTGYNDYSNFNKHFVKHTGMSAPTWKKQNLHNTTLVH